MIIFLLLIFDNILLISCVILINLFFLKFLVVIVGVFNFIFEVNIGFFWLNGNWFLLIVIFVLYNVFLVFFLVIFNFDLIFIKIKWLFVLFEINLYLSDLNVLFKVLVFLIICVWYILKLGFSVFLNVIVFVVIICINGLFCWLGNIEWFIFLVIFVLFVRMILLCGFFKVLCVVDVIIFV